MINLLIFGPPGAGKGTQAAFVAQKYNLKHISSGELLRQEAKDGEFKDEVAKYLDAGHLVPDELITKIIKDELEDTDKKQGVLLDGYPRTIKQAEFLDSLLKDNNRQLNLVINLELEDDIAISRIMSRGENSGRADDRSEIIKKRFHIYHQETEPLLNYYKNQKKLKHVNGRPDVEAVKKELEETIEKLLNK